MTQIDEAFLWLNRAEDTLNATAINFEHDLILAGVNRAYYSMFYCILALLRTENITTKSHTGAFTKFSELFIKTGNFSKEEAYHIRKAFEYRQAVDYDIEVQISKSETLELHENAKRFYESVKLYLTGLRSE